MQYERNDKEGLLGDFTILEDGGHGEGNISNRLFVPPKIYTKRSRLPPQEHKYICT
jgi:hypothetical protein